VSNWRILGLARPAAAARAASDPAPPAACVQVLAADLDLLNPPAELEKRKHKLKRLVQSPNSFFMDVKCQVRTCFVNDDAELSAAAHAVVAPVLTLRASFPPPGVLHNHDSVQPQPDGCALRQLQRRAVPTHRWTRTLDGGCVARRARHTGQPGTRSACPRNPRAPSDHEARALNSQAAASGERETRVVCDATPCELPRYAHALGVEKGPAPGHTQPQPPLLLRH